MSLLLQDQADEKGQGCLRQEGVGRTSTTTEAGQGYYHVAADSGNFTFGDATFFGSMGGQLLSLQLTPIPFS